MSILRDGYDELRELKKSLNDFDAYSIINTTYTGVELCAECGCEFDYEYKPMIYKGIACTHCGYFQPPCTLCDSRTCSPKDECSLNIIASLINYNLDALIDWFTKENVIMSTLKDFYEEHCNDNTVRLDRIWRVGVNMTVNELIKMLNELPEDRKNDKVVVYDTKYENYYSPDISLRTNNTVCLYDI